MRFQLLSLSLAALFTLPALAEPVSRDTATVINGVRISPPPTAVLKTNTRDPARWTLQGDSARLDSVRRVPFHHAWRQTRAKLTEERVEMIGDRLVRIRYGVRGKTHVALADLGPGALVVAKGDLDEINLLLGAVDPHTKEADTLLTVGRDPFASPWLR